MTKPNLVTVSGRENLSVRERVDLLCGALMMPPFNGITNLIIIRDQHIHDLKLTIGWIRGLIQFYNQARNRGTTDECLQKGADIMFSDIECLVLAWTRGGHSEYVRVRRLQLERATR